MDEQSAGVLEAVVGHTGSELILFFVIAAIIAIPVCVFIHNENKRRDKREAERHKELLEERKQLIEVISENSRVNTGLKVVLENYGEKTKESIERIHLRIDETAKDQAVIKENTKDILALLSKRERER